MATSSTSSAASDVIAIIPARGGSKRLVRKNLMRIGGHPLVAHSIMHAKASRHVSRVYVSTEDEEIARVSRQYGAEVIPRPVDLAGDQATSESALLHALDARRAQGLADPELVVFLQCTSPVRGLRDIDQAIERLRALNADSLFSATEFNRLIWAMKGDAPYSLNYDYHRRQREQEMAVQYRENGSLYVFRPSVLREDNNRLGGKMAVYEMDYWSSFQIDTHEHVELIDWILHRPEFSMRVPWPEPVSLVVFDFDGVLTDNTVDVDQAGVESVRCHRGDGWGLARLREAGIPMLVLSTEENPVVAARCAKLKLPCLQGSGDKARDLEKYLQTHGISPASVVYVGNDVNDLDCMRRVGLAVAVGDAEPEVMSVSSWVLRRFGGRGAVREFCDLLLAHLSDTKE